MSIDFDYGFRAPERVPAKPRPGKFKADELVAWCGLLAALRRDPDLFAGRSTCIAITLPPHHPFEPYEFAANALGSWLDSRRRKRPSEASLPVIRFVGGRALAEGSTRPRKPGEVSGTVRTCKVVLGIAHGEDEFSAEFLTLADRIVTVAPATARRIKFAARRVAELDLPDDLADDLLRLPLESLSLAIRKGRSLRQVREAAARLFKAPSAPVKPLTLDDLKGFGPADEWGRQLATDLADWRSGRLRWADVDRGLLLSGPPGCGKTTYARALAGTCGVPLVVGSVARWQAAGHLGDLLKAMRSCFDDARSKAPCILFIDEVDAFGDRATFDPHHRDYSTQVVAGLLECLDGVEGREGIVVVGAANYPERLDAALRRPGRLDRHIEIPLPDAPAREGIILFHASGESPDGDLTDVVAKTEGWSGAQLEQMVRTARRAARLARRKMTVEDLLAALPEMLLIPEHLVWRNAVHEAGHVVAILELGMCEVEFVAIRRDLDPENSSQSAGVTKVSRPPIVDRDRAWYLDEITMLLAGAAAEEILLGRRSEGWGGGPGSDLQRATELAVTMEASFGLGEGLAYLGDRGDAQRLLHASPALKARVDKILAESFKRARTLIDRRQHWVGRISVALISPGSDGRLQSDEIRAITSGSQDEPLSEGWDPKPSDVAVEQQNPRERF